jgi:threonine dehydrogenase-like Zn-dependent dehydrogenase
MKTTPRAFFARTLSNREMRALVKEGRGVSLQHVPVPTLGAPDDALVRVVVAGLCRTDIAVAEGRVPSRDPIVLGHELAGVVQAVGPAAHNVSPGDRVTVMPMLACGRCAGCEAGRCTARRMLGIDEHGAFAELLRVPARALFRLPDELPFALGAYVEPIAAALAVTTIELPGGRGAILGDNRIAALVECVLRAHGRDVAIVGDPKSLGTDRWDFVIETALTTESMRAILAAVRPFGMVILKSRPSTPIEVDAALAVRKSLTLRAVEYAPFESAIAFAVAHREALGAMLDEPRPLEDFAALFARKSEAKKPLFRVSVE